MQTTQIFRFNLPHKTPQWSKKEIQLSCPQLVWESGDNHVNIWFEIKICIALLVLLLTFGSTCLSDVKKSLFLQYLGLRWLVSRSNYLGRFAYWQRLNLVNVRSHKMFHPNFWQRNQHIFLSARISWGTGSRRKIHLHTTRHSKRKWSFLITSATKMHFFIWIYRREQILS